MRKLILVLLTVAGLALLLGCGSSQLESRVQGLESQLSGQSARIAKVEADLTKEASDLTSLGTRLESLSKASKELEKTVEQTLASQNGLLLRVDELEQRVAAVCSAVGFPTANFSFRPESPTTADTIQFADSSLDPDGKIIKWLWNFGDTGTSEDQTPSHRYASAATYTVTLTVVDQDRHASAPAVKEVTVGKLGARIRIGYVNYDGKVPRTEADEYVEIINDGDEAQEIHNWSLKSCSGEDCRDVERGQELRFDRRYDGSCQMVGFSSYLLKPGEAIRVYTNECHPESGGFSFERGTAIWANDPPHDWACLFDEKGNLIDKSTY